MPLMLNGKKPLLRLRMRGLMAGEDAQKRPVSTSRALHVVIRDIFRRMISLSLIVLD